MHTSPPLSASLFPVHKEMLFFISRSLRMSEESDEGPTKPRALEAPCFPASLLPCFIHMISSKCQYCSYRVQQRRSHILAIAITQAWSTELASHPAAALIPTHCLGIDGLLPTLVACVTLRGKA